MQKTDIGQYFPFLFFGVILLYFVYSFVRYGGIRGTVFGARVKNVHRRSGRSSLADGNEGPGQHT